MPTRPAPHRPLHRPQRPFEKSKDPRPSSCARGYNYEWQQYTKVFLAKPENALCVECQKRGVATPATVVDHIKPHKGNMVLFWDPKNHQGLCTTDHNRKTATKDGGFGRHGDHE